MLSAKFENWLAPKPPWTSSKMTAARLETLKKAIVGLVMTVEEVEGSFKLNQHKSDVDHVAVADALAVQADAGAQHLAGAMRALRPQLFDAQTTQLNAKAFSSEVATGSRDENASNNNLGSSMPEGTVS
jgi:transcriptional regulator